MNSIVVFPFHDWKKCQAEGFKRRDTQIISGLEKLSSVDKILVVDRPVSTPMIFYHILKGQQWRAEGGTVVNKHLTSRLMQLSSRFWVLDTVQLEPISSIFLGRRWWPYILRSNFLRDELLSTIDYLGIEHPILWLFTPIAAPIISKIDTSLVVFDALDNWLTHDGLKSYYQASSEGYQILKREADLAFCGSQQMRDYMSSGRPKVYWIPNGVDIDLFMPVELTESELPDDIRRVPKPRVGYVGVIDSRLDVELLTHVVKYLEDLSFVFVGWIGKATVDITSLTELPNVYLLGQKPYELMPAYINTFDVCIMPHKVNAYTNGMSPLKLFEYLACGKPVVTTPVAGTEQFSNVIYIVDNEADFAQSIRISLKEDNSVRRLTRRESVCEHSWSNRVDFIWKAVEEFNS